MKESAFGFVYSWADLQLIRALAITVFASQVVGALLALWLANHADSFSRLWFGAAVATFPAFLAGVAIQSQTQPGSITNNRVMVWRFGLVALVLSVAALFMAAPVR